MEPNQIQTLRKMPHDFNLYYFHIKINPNIYSLSYYPSKIKTFLLKRSE